MPEISAKVAKVLGKYQIAINAGAEHGVAPGARVRLWRIEDIRDPESGKYLGSVRLEKLRLTVREVQEKFSVAEVSAPSLNFSSLIFSGKPEKSISTNGADVDSVRVKVGEEASVSIPSRQDEQGEVPGHAGENDETHEIDERTDESDRT